jgi:hypothetical protein
LTQFPDSVRLIKWFVLGTKYDLSRAQEIRRASVRDPEEIFGAKLGSLQKADDDLGIFRRGGVASFICSDYVTHCYNFILGQTSPFAADIFTKDTPNIN